MLAGEGEARDRDLDHQHRIGGVRGRVGANVAAHDGDVRLGLRDAIEGDRAPAANRPALAKGAREGPLDELDRRVVRRALGLRDDELAVDQLDTVTGSERLAGDAEKERHP